LLNTHRCIRFCQGSGDR